MARINSRAKGCRCERMVRDLFREAGYLKARRGQQFSGSPDSPDVVVPELPWIHVEAKCVERLNLQDAMDQSKRDAGPKQVPIVIHKRSNCEPIVSMEAKDWFRLLRGEFDSGDLGGMEI